MALRHLGWMDVRRLLAACNDLAEKHGGVMAMMGKVSSVIGSEGDSDEPKIFANPGPVVEPELRALVSEVRESVAARYGEPYATELWERLRQS